MRARTSPLSREEYAQQRGAIPTSRMACSTYLRNAGPISALLSGYLALYLHDDLLQQVGADVERGS
jgi:hypothetical protein